MTETSELRELRVAVGATQSQFADRMGVSLRSYEELESGRTRTRPLHLRAAEMAAIHFAQDKGVEDQLPKNLRLLTRYENDLLGKG